MVRKLPPLVHGLAVIDKPAGVTSHDVVAMVRRHLHERRVGHAGTLDPDATGVLLVGVGNATRLLRFLTALGKTYTAEVVFGVETSTLDAAGEVTARHDMTGLTIERIREAVAAHLTGPILQVPPMVSAIQIDGKRLHELAREGIEVEREPRPVTVHRFEVDDVALGPDDDPLLVRIEVQCSSGTYVRSLAADLGRLLGGGAHLRNLRRTACGSFDESQATSVDQLVLLTPSQALRDYPHIEVDAATTALVRNGRALGHDTARVEQGWTGDGPWAVVAAGDELLAVYARAADGLARPEVVLPIPPSSVT